MFGVYRVTEFIARGGFAQVWTAWDTQLSRLVALKIVERGANNDADTLAFAREAALVAQLKHPNIVPLYDYGETDRVRYLVTRYIIGEALAQTIDKKRLSPIELIRLMYPIAQALDFIHGQNIVHRDLKPGNILLDATGIPYLTDFGLARQLSEHTPQMHSISGTILYMAPEQFTGGAITTASDQYSFGLILFQTLTGQLPLSGKFVYAMRQSNTNERLPDVTTLNPTLPASLNSILWSLTELDPVLRPRQMAPVVNVMLRLLTEGEQAVNLDSDGYSTARDPAPSAISQSTQSLRVAEINNLLSRAIPSWEDEKFSLSLTHFVLLNVLLSPETDSLSSEVRTLMLRGALEFDQQVEKWWQLNDEAGRSRAILHGLHTSTPTVAAIILHWLVKCDWIPQFDPPALDTIATLALPVSDLTPQVLDFLERALPNGRVWTDDLVYKGADAVLVTLANGTAPLGDRAARLISMKRRAVAFHAVIVPARRLLIYEQAASLPISVSLKDRLALMLRLTRDQIVRLPMQAAQRLGWAVLGAGVGFGYLVYEAFRSTDFLGSRRWLNTIGDGLLFGLAYGLAVWISRHIVEVAAILPRWVRLVFGLAVGTAIFALGASALQTLIYDDVLDPGVALLAGLLFVGGFTLSVGMDDVWQVIGSTAGVILALLIPWMAYLNDGTRAPFIFDENYPEAAIGGAVLAALLIAVIVLGYRWRARLRSETAASDRG
jgi:serine/threonine protein kinase